MTTLTNVPIIDLLEVLTKLASKYQAVDIIIDPEEKRITIEPIDTIVDRELDEDNIYKLV